MTQSDDAKAVLEELRGGYDLRLNDIYLSVLRDPFVDALEDADGPGYDDPGDPQHFLGFLGSSECADLVDRMVSREELRHRGSQAERIVVFWREQALSAGLVVPTEDWYWAAFLGLLLSIPESAGFLEFRSEDESLFRIYIVDGEPIRVEPEIRISWPIPIPHTIREE